jgi:hypothetical protein
MHPFYPLQNLSLPGNVKHTLPDVVLASQNYYRPTWAVLGARRLKNVNVVLDWVDINQAESDLSKPSTNPPLMSETHKKQIELTVELLSGQGPPNGDGVPTAALEAAFGQWLDMKHLDECIGKVPQRNHCVPATDVVKGLARYALSSDTRWQHNRYLVVISLREAETLRRVIHTSNSSGAQQQCFALRLLDGTVLDSTAMYDEKANAGAHAEAVAFQALRFHNCDLYYTQPQCALLLQALSGSPAVQRRAYVESMLCYRHRERKRIDLVGLKRVLSSTYDVPELLLHLSLLHQLRSIAKSSVGGLPELLYQIDRKDITGRDSGEMLLDSLASLLRDQGGVSVPMDTIHRFTMWVCGASEGRVTVGQVITALLKRTV